MVVIARMLAHHWVRPLLTLLLVVVLATVFSPTLNGFPIFWNSNNLLNILRQVSENGVLAIAMTLVIISGGIDLSVGSLLALSGTAFAHVSLRYGWSLPSAIAVALLAATLFGTASGAAIARWKMQPFVVTLAAMIGSRGFARWLVDNATIDIGFGDRPVDAAVQFIGRKAVVVPTFLCTAVIGYVLLRATRFGRYLIAVGGNETSARLSGIPVGWVKLRVYALSGFLAGIAGIIHCCQNSQGNANAGVAYELDAIAAAVIGGTSLAGGKGGIVGTVVGAIALGILSNLLGLRNLDENIQWMLKAGIIIGAVWLQSVGKRKETLV